LLLDVLDSNIKLSWTVHNHSQAPAVLKQIILTLVLIRDLEHQCILHLLPNELLFIVFGYLPWHMPGALYTTA
jgi:hypothetical protein